ncbi:MAG: serine hydrolase [Cyclobacteriaceae bacterium]|nr:serine hydrolase [Cyclobacteriaceae bacterium]
MSRKYIQIALFYFVVLSVGLPKGFGQHSELMKAPMQNHMKHWVDSVLNTFSLDQKIGQLFMTRMYSNKGGEYEQNLKNKIKHEYLGGVFAAQGGPIRHANLLNECQKMAEIPLLVAIDGEWGLGMRLDSTMSFPFQMTLGAIEDNDLIYRMGSEIADQLKMMGIQINFAPVADVNNNPANPVIGYRSFGEDMQNVSTKSLAYMNGMQNNGVLATAKHFPGHGDTDTDSHKSLPLITQSKERIDSLELTPFKTLINGGLGGMMIAHLSIPSLDNTKNLPSTLSKPIVTGLLKDELGFEGLVFTDDMAMKGLTEHHSLGEAVIQSILVGNDVILLSENTTSAIKEVKVAVRRKQISVQLLNEKCRKILSYKYMLGLTKKPKIEIEGLEDRLNTPQAKFLERQLIEASITLLRNENNVLPLQRLDTLHMASLSLGTDSVSSFQKMLSNYTQVDHFNLPKDATKEQINVIKKILNNYNMVAVGIHEVYKRSYKELGYNKEMAAFINDLGQTDNVIVSSFRNAYTLDYFPDMHQSPMLMTTYQDSEISQEVAAQLIFGAVGAKGKLPVTVNQYFSLGDGVTTKGKLRLKYTVPEEVGISSDKLKTRIDSVVTAAIVAGAFPGCQILIAKDHNVIYYDTFGYQTYDSLKEINKDDLYDFASVTKVTGPLPALMKLHDENKFDLDAPLKLYWPDFKRSNKADIDWRNVLAHNAKLKAWIPYWTTTTKKNGKYKSKTLSTDSSENYSIKITDRLYEHNNYKSKIYKAIKKTPLNEKEGYLYSGLSFYLFPEMIKNMTGESYESYIKKNFYKPLGANSLTYNPLRFYKKDNIVPTELDTFFRKEQIHGTVHDEGAVMMGGVSGNAGLFGNINDLAKLMQMYLNLGHYGGRQYISKSTFTKFSTCQFCEEGNRRGLGFDKPLLEKPERGYVAKGASTRSFGHSGYTGTMVWVDPEYDLMFIFLSNRVYPTRDNKKLYTLNIRPQLHQAVYDLMKE